MTGPTPAGTQRRIRALYARGWSDQSIERATGIPAVRVKSSLADRRKVTADFCQSVAQAYERLWDTPPPRSTQEERDEADAAQQRARLCAWPPPMALDDDEIDKPEYQPTGWKRAASTHVRAADLVEDVYFVRQTGGYAHASQALVAMRLGVTKAALEKALHREGRSVPAEQELEAG